MISIKHKNKVAISILVITFLIIVAAFILNGNDDTDQLQASETTLDLASYSIINNGLLEAEEIIFENSSMKITGMYFDGIRLYLEIDNADETKSLNDIKLISNEKQFDIKTIYLQEETNTQNVLVVFNDIFGADLLKCKIEIDNETYTNDFNINNEFSISQVRNTQFEELVIKNVSFGETSTLIEFNLIADIDANSFQIKFNESEVISGEIVEKNDDTIKLLIPTNLSENDEMTLICNNSYGNVELRVLFNLMEKDTDSLL